MSDLLYHTFFDLAPDPMAITDFDNGCIIDINKAFVAWSRYSRDELIGHTTTELGFWVDDESRKTVLRELKEAGFFTDVEIDLVILDMVMPGMSGGETFDSLKEFDPDIKVVLSSGYSITGQAQEILDRGCKGFLQKPFRLDMLSNKVREMFD